ncbi:MAG TPA: sulfatase-like hydrolase/transferase, partial [bacterium]
MVPVLVIAATDLAVRWRKVAEWNRLEVLLYGVSVLFALACIRVVARLLPDRLHHPRLYWPIAAVLGGVSGFILLVHFDYYAYFGVHPEIIGIGHLVGEPTEALSVMLDEFSPLRAVAFVALVLAGTWAWRVATDPPPGRRTFWICGVLVVVLIPVFHQNVSMSPGNFLPSVNLVFTSTKAIQYAVQGRGEFRRMQVSTRIPVPPQPSKPPYNVLFLVNESLRARETGYNGYTRDTTPNVDAFLQAHPRTTFSFSQCFTNSTKTSESVPSILTGVHPVEDYRKLHQYPLFYEYMKAFPDTRSFLYAAHGYNVANFRFFLRTPRLDDLVYQENSGHPRFNSLGMDDRFLVPPFEKTLAGLPASTRFVGILHMNGPHYPYQVPEADLKWGRATRQDQYDNSIRYQDNTIGAFLRVLEKSGRLDNTIIFSTSDHGEAFSEHGVQGHRRTFYEEIVHIPCWMHLPESLAQTHGVVVRANLGTNVTNLDWVPTLVDLLGLSKVP